jgi:hypothetical protein
MLLEDAIPRASAKPAAYVLAPLDRRFLYKGSSRDLRDGSRITKPGGPDVPRIIDRWTFSSSAILRPTAKPKPWNGG